MKKTSVSPTLKIIVFAVAALVFLFSVYKIATMLEFSLEDVVSGGNSSRVIEYEGTRYIPDGNVTAVMILGIDTDGEVVGSESYRNDGLADFISVAAFNTKDKTCKVLHVNRDTMAEMNALGLGGATVGSSYAQIALAYSYGSGLEDSCINTKNAVSKLLGNIVISNYVSLNMDGIAAVNDLVGGVEVTVNEDLTAIDPSLTKGSTVLLNGRQALNFVRARYGVGEQTNIERMSRQRQYMESFYATLTKRLADGDINMSEMLDEVEPFMVTDCNTGVVSMLSDRVRDFEFKGVTSVSGETVVGDDGVEFYPDSDSLMNAILDLFYKPE